MTCTSEPCAGLTIQEKLGTVLVGLSVYAFITGPTWLKKLHAAIGTDYEILLALPYAIGVLGLGVLGFWVARLGHKNGS